MKLYGFPLSGNTHKVRLLLAALRLPYEETTVDVTQGAHKLPTFLALNPRGQIPVLDDDGTIIYDAQAILMYLVAKYDSAKTWFSDRPEEIGKIAQWLSFAAFEIQVGPHLARLNQILSVPVPVDFVRSVAHSALEILNLHLTQREWIELKRPTIADLACFPCVGLAPEGKLDLGPYTHVRSWIARVKSLPNYVEMPGLNR